MIMGEYFRPILDITHIIFDRCSGRFAPVMFMFDKVGRVQGKVPETEDRDSQIEAILEAASSAGGEDFEVLEDSSIVEVRRSISAARRRFTQSPLVLS